MGGDCGYDHQPFPATAMNQTTLPDAPWRQREGLALLCNILGAEAGLSRFVGGAVRDTLLGQPVSDIDLATQLAPAQVMEKLKAAGLKAIPTGLAHGTITAVLPGATVEVTTLRRDLSTDGRHATIAYTDDWREDAARRDFTINALYADPLSGALFDYFGGLDDLALGRVRFIGDPLQRIAEDHLRILRFFRFVSRFSGRADAAGLAAATARANDMMALSRERIADELLKLLLTQHAPAIAKLMVESSILAPVLPEITIAGAQHLEQLAAREAASGVAPNAIRRLASLLPADPAVAETIGARLKLSKAQRKQLIAASAPLDAMPARALAYRFGIGCATDRVLLAQSDRKTLASELASLAGWPVPSLPISGGALVERGVATGPAIARTLKAIETAWVAQGFPTGGALGAIVDAAVAQALALQSSE